MSTSPGPESSNANTTVSNVLIPEGLLQSVGSRLYNYQPRHTENVEGRQPLLQVIQQPAQAILATHALARSRTPDYGPSGQPQIGLGRGPASTRLNQSRRISQLEQPRRDRATSINLATLFRQRERARVNDSLSPFVQTGTSPRNVALLFGQNTLPTTLDDEDTTLQKSLETDVWPTQRSPPSQSPVLHVGATGQDGEIMRQPQRYSFVPGQDFPSLRRPTLDVDRRVSLARRLSTAVTQPLSRIIPQRKTSIWNTYESAKLRQKHLQRSKSFQIFFQYTTYLLILAFVYFVLVGRPLWGGTVWYIYILFQYHLTFVGGSAIFIGLAFFYAFGPLLVFFERAAVAIPLTSDHGEPKRPLTASSSRSLSDTRSLDQGKAIAGNLTTALLIPCYKSAKLLPATLDHALKIFPATSIFILANGNSPTPLDNTEEVCTEYNVNHIWIPIGSKIVAQYVGANIIRHSFPYVLLIDDDCLLPPNFPVVAERLRGNVRCLGYTLASIGAGRSRGTWCQQAQDLEYKLSGLQRFFAGKIGSATFPHGAIVLWDTEFLIRTFKKHPGFSVSEDWFFGHVARQLGSRITMCTSVFVETETPDCVFFAASGGARGGFGEMTVFKQRFKRWNFFFVNGCWYNLIYILFSWRLGFREIGAKLFVFQEVYETFLYLVTPLVLPISFVVRPKYTACLFAGTLGLYLLNSVLFNEIHLRRSGKMVSRTMLFCYYMPFKLALTCVNVVSCWWSLWQYARYFARRHPRVVEDPSAVGVVLKIEEASNNDNDEKSAIGTGESQEHYEERNANSGEAGTPERPQAIQTQSQQSGVSAASGRVSLKRPRRLTVTPIKVDIVDDPVIVPQEILDSNELDDNVDPLFIQNVDRADSTNLGTRSINDGASRQIENSRFQWTFDNVHYSTRDVGALTPVSEATEFEWQTSRFENVFIKSLN